MAAIRPKRMYLVKRNPRFSAETFVPRWREHGRLAMQFMARQHWDNVVRYAHYDPVRDPRLTGVTREYDGVGMIGFRDVDARKRHVGFVEARSVLEADEDDAFGERVNRAGLVADEQVIVDGPTTGIGVVRVVAKERGPLAAWQAAQRQRVPAALAGMLRRYVHDVPLPPENGVAWGLDCLAVEELWFDDVETTVRAWPSIGATATGDGPVVVVREVLLYPSPHGH